MCSSQVNLHWASPHFPWGMQRICGPFFFRIYLCLSRDFVNQRVFCCSIYIETAQNSREESNEFADLLFWRLSLCLSRDSLSRDSRSLNLCVLFKFIFLLIPLIHSAPFLRFSHILLYTNFFWCNITTRNIFLIPKDPVARNLIIIFHFSSQRPHLNYIFFSNVYSFDTMEFSKKHKC